MLVQEKFMEDSEFSATINTLHQTSDYGLHEAFWILRE